MTMNEYILETLKTLITLLGVSYTDVSVTVDEKMSSPRFVISTTESSTLIGEQGANLLALNHLMKRIVERKFPGEPHSFMLDVNDFQKKHMEEIRANAHMLAERARYFKSSVEMDPMSSYERMIVHAEFTDTPDIVTESSGYGKDRHLVLKYKEPEESAVA